MNTQNLTNEKIEEKAFLVVSETKCGVSNRLEDVICFLNEAMNNNEPVLTVPGYRDSLLEEQHKLLCHDNIDVMENGQLIFPERTFEYGCFNRQIAGKMQLRTIVSRLLK